jgi:hypothetical protein
MGKDIALACYLNYINCLRVIVGCLVRPPHPTPYQIHRKTAQKKTRRKPHANEQKSPTYPRLQPTPPTTPVSTTIACRERAFLPPSPDLFSPWQGQATAAVDVPSNSPKSVTKASPSTLGGHLRKFTEYLPRAEEIFPASRRLQSPSGVVGLALRRSWRLSPSNIFHSVI